MATRGDLPLQFTWLLNDAPMDAALPNVKITIDDFSSHLSISSLTEAHDAVYTCKVANKGGSVEHSAQLQVMRKFQRAVEKTDKKVNVPPRWVERPLNSSGTPGSRIEIACRTSGRPAPEVRENHFIREQPT